MALCPRCSGALSVLRDATPTEGFLASLGMTCLVDLRNIFDVYTEVDGSRFFRSSASAH